MKDPLLSLAPSELRSLAAAVRNGRLAPPFSAVTLQRFLELGATEQVSGRLTELSAIGMAPEALSVCLEVAADALAHRLPLEDFVDLVTTGPEAGGVANRNTAVVVSELFGRAQRSVLVAGYAVYQGQRIFRTLAERMATNPGLTVRMFLDIPRKSGDTSTSEAIKARFCSQFKAEQWPQGARFPSVYCCDQFLEINNPRPASLHAKCIVIDDEQTFVSSANFTEAAQQRNIEVGLLLDSRIIAERLTRFFEALIDRGYFSRVI